VIVKLSLAGNRAIVVFREPHSVFVLLAVVESTADLPLAGQARHHGYSAPHRDEKIQRQVLEQDTVAAETRNHGLSDD
jgi:hypothetical protein